MFPFHFQAPNITGIQDPISVAEATSTETLLDVFTVFDDDGDSITSCIRTGDSGEFDIRQNGTGFDNKAINVNNATPFLNFTKSRF